MHTNQQIAEQLQRTASELGRSRANLYRVRAYRQAATTILGLDRAVEDLLQEEGKSFLRTISGLGSHLVETISHFATTGEWKTYDELRAVRGASRR
jgi:DNA polymerase (family 10)